MVRIRVRVRVIVTDGVRVRMVFMVRVRFCISIQWRAEIFPEFTNSCPFKNMSKSSKTDVFVSAICDSRTLHTFQFQNALVTGIQIDRTHAFLPS